MSDEPTVSVKLASAAVWQLWEVTHQELTDPDGTQTTHIAELMVIKQEACRLCDGLRDQGDCEDE